MQSLSAYIQALEDSIPHAEKINPTVSSGAVGWHVQHCLMVISGIANQLKKSDPSQYKYSFNKIRTLVYLMNKIPRGKGKAPSVVNPVEVFSAPQLHQMIQSAKDIIEELKTLPKYSHFMHPYFGMLHLRSSYKFLNIHTNHHLKIIKDIVKS
jgi:hypothetical protein